MSRPWTFGQKLAAGFAATLALTLLIASMAVATLRTVVIDKDMVLTQYAEPMRQAQRLNTQMTEVMAHNRGFLLTGNPEFLRLAEASREGFRADLAAVSASSPAADHRELDAIERDAARYLQAFEQVLAAHREGRPHAQIVQQFHHDVAAPALALKQQLDRYGQRKAAEMAVAKQRSTEAAERASAMVGAIALVAVALSVAIAFVLTRTLSRQIGSAVHELQSSSTELQAAAHQQATGSGEQAAAMTEVSTTMKELLATSRQIAESAQRVAAIAGETALAARSGDQTVDHAQEALAVIRRQMDQIVAHMLDLGRKSQQIGGILDIIKELAEQTNILSINATIEAAGAGDSGKRFAAVAEEIRKLADRVTGSTGEIRGLIEEMRSATHTTVMATENGSKAVDAGARQSGELAAAFQQIVALVETTAEAAREIELSTKQQTSAVEQVNVAIFDAAQAAKETAASSSQTLQTSSQVAEVSRGLAQLARAQARASA